MIDCARRFDAAVLDTFCKKLQLPALSDVARKHNLCLPIYLGGFGLRSMQKVSPVAWWCALAQYFHLVSPLVPSLALLDSSSTVRFVQNQYSCHRTLLGYDVKLPRPFPLLAEHFFSDFKAKNVVAGFQRSILSAINIHDATRLILDSKSKSPDKARLTSLSERSSSYWLSTPPVSPSFLLSSQDFNAACRLRLGLPPVDGLKFCGCGANLADLPLHFLTCTTLRSSVISRHDRLFQCLAKLARLTGLAVPGEPHLSSSEEATRADGLFFFTYMVPGYIDVGVVHPAAPSYLRSGHKLLAAAGEYEKEKTRLYGMAAVEMGAKFYPCILDSFGAFGPGLVKFIGTLLDEFLGSGIKSIENLPTKLFIYRALSFCLQAGNSNILLTGSRLARAKSLNWGQ